jgi:hypothetical protein
MLRRPSESLDTRRGEGCSNTVPACGGKFEREQKIEIRNKKADTWFCFGFRDLLFFRISRRRREP